MTASIQFYNNDESDISGQRRSKKGGRICLRLEKIQIGIDSPKLNVLGSHSQEIRIQKSYLHNRKNKLLDILKFFLAFIMHYEVREKKKLKRPENVEKIDTFL